MLNEYVNHTSMDRFSIFKVLEIFLTEVTLIVYHDNKPNRKEELRSYCPDIRLLSDLLNELNSIDFI